MTRLLYLVRHASPAVRPDIPSPLWELSERGAEEARALGETARGWGLQALYSSSEPKAMATAAIIGDAVGLPVLVADGLQELRFDQWIPNADAFGEAVRTILEHPGRSVRGAERADAAAARFDAAVRLIEGGPSPAALVSHGRVLTAWLRQRLRLDDPYALWRSIPMPGWTAIDLDAPGGGAAPQFYS
jgi:broad specificity phosphatase PhoE